MEKSSLNKTSPKRNRDKIILSLFKKTGYLAPTTRREVEDFETFFGSTEIDIPEEVNNTDFLFKKLKEDNSETNNRKKELPSQEEKGKLVSIQKHTNVDYYRRTVLAAEIVYELKSEMTLGHLKLQKLIYLAQKTEQIDLPVNFLKQAMGPYDPKLMRSIDKQFLIRKWFQFCPNEKLKYKSLEKAGEHKEAFQKYFKNLSDKISWLIETFRKVKSPRVEVIATIYECWEELIKENKVIDDNNLLEKFFAWSKHKEKFSEGEVLGEVRWMENNFLYPKIT